MFYMNIKEPKFEYLIEGKELHNELVKIEEIRKLFLRKWRFRNCKKLFRVRVESTRYGLSGILDLVLICNQDVIPVEIKLCNFENNYVPIHHKAQLMAYALCLEEIFGKYVNKGFLYYVKNDKLIEVYLNDEIRKQVINSIIEIGNVLSGKYVPRIVKEVSKCRNCWYCRYCKD